MLVARTATTLRPLLFTSLKLRSQPSAAPAWRLETPRTAAATAAMASLVIGYSFRGRYGEETTDFTGREARRSSFRSDRYCGLGDRNRTPEVPSEISPGDVQVDASRAHT